MPTLEMVSDVGLISFQDSCSLNSLKLKIASTSKQSQRNQNGLTLFFKRVSLTFCPIILDFIMRFIIRLLVLLAIIAGIIYGWEKLKNLSWFQTENQDQTNHNIIVKEISTLGKMELIKYNFRDVVEQEIVKQWLPNSKALLIVQGEAVGCIDLTKIQYADIATFNDTLIVHLPEPELCTVKIDHQKSRVYNVEFALFDEAELVQKAFQQAEKQIEKSALEMGILAQTRASAEKILKPFIEKVSGKKVLLRYRMKAALQKPK